MSLNVRSKPHSRESLQRDLPEDSLPDGTLSERRSGGFFYVFSAAIHVAAALALSGTWMLGTVATSKSASAAPPPPEKPAVARMAIDVGPIKFCEMNIETLVGKPQSQSGR